MAGKHCAKGDCGAAAKQNKQRQKSNEPEQKEESCDGCTEIDLHGAPCKVVYGLRGNQKEIDEIQKKYDDELRDLERKFEQLSAPFFQRRKALILGGEDVVQSEVDQGKTAVEKQIAKLDRKTSENQDTTTGQTSKIEEIESEDDADDKRPKRVLKKKGQKEVEKDSKAPEASAAAAPAPPEASDATPKAAVKGVPKFWLTVLQHEFDDLITKRDEAVLEYLTDIECTSIDNDPFAGYILTFHFAENPFFSDAKLVKTYHLEKYFNDRILVRTEGCTIDWKARSLNTTMEIKKKTQKSKTKKATRVVEKEVKVDSFFDFFHPPQIPQDDEVEDDGDDVDYDELEEQIEYDYEIGNTLKEEILPLAVDSYLGFSALSEGSWMYPDMRGLLNAADAQGLQSRKNNGGEAQECKQQ